MIDFVLHYCHNRGCINPYHLHFGTNLDNMNEMKLANRSCKGEMTKSSKLTNLLILEILSKINKFEFNSLCDIQNYYNLENTEIIRQILIGHTWTHLTSDFLFKK